MTTLKEHVRSLDGQGYSTSEIAEKLGCSKRSVRRHKSKLNQTPSNPDIEEKISSSYGLDSGVIDVRSLTVHTLEQALEVANVDLEKWSVDRFIINSWQVTMKIDDIPEHATNYQVKVWLKPKIINPIEVALNNLLENIPTFRFARVPRFTAPSGIAAELAPIDAHLGKLAWKQETGRVDYDLEIAVNNYLEGVEKSLSFLSMFKPSVIYYIVGQDLMHVDNYSGLTPKGRHVLDVDSRFPKIYDGAFETVMRSVYMCRDVAPVEVIWIPGNHDLHASRCLCHSIKEHFRDDDFVKVDISPAQRKARLWGKLLVGWAHEIVGKHQSWANELAQQWPELWGKSVFREWHHGHKHKKAEVKTHPIMTQGGVLMRQLTALSPIDAWHYENLFTDAVPGTESFVWSKEHGVVDNHIEWVVSGSTRNN